MTVPVSLGRWAEWTLFGNAVANGATLNCPGAAANSGAWRRVSVRPGETVRVAVTACVKSGAVAGGRIGVRIMKEGAGTLAESYRELEYADYMESVVEITAPLWADSTCYAEIEFLALNGFGTVDFLLPNVAVGVGVVGVPRTLGAALLRWNAGTGQFTIPPDYKRTGILAQSYNGGTKVLTIQLEKVPSSIGVGPLCFAQLSVSNQAPGLTSRVQAYDFATGNVIVAFFDSASNAYVDLTGFPGLGLDLQFKAEL
jgi:hypothetical protein